MTTYQENTPMPEVEEFEDGFYRVNNPILGQPEGQELLNGLYAVQKFVQRIEALQLKWGELAKLLRDYIVDTDTTKGKTQYGLFVMGLAISIWAALAALLSGSILSLAVVVVIVVLYVYGKAKKKEDLFKWASLLLAFIGIRFILGQISFAASSHNFGSLIITLILLGIAIFAGQAMLKRHKASVDAHNGKLRVQMNEAWQEIERAKDEMLSLSLSWYPQKYYYSDAVEHFIDYVENHRADTVKEMVNQYESDKKHQEEMAKLDECIGNQKEMMHLMRFNNLLSIISAGANIVTALNTSDIASDTDAMARKFRAK